MKKVIAILIIVGAFGWGTDAYFRHWTTQRLETTIKYAYPNTKVSVTLGGYVLTSGSTKILAKPIFPSLILLHKVSDVTINMEGQLHMGQLAVDDYTFTANSIKLDNAQFFDSKRTVVRESSGGAVEMRLSETSLSTLRPDVHIFIDGASNATANTSTGRQKLTVNVTDTSIDFTAGGEALGSIDTTNNPFLPCKPEASFGSHAFYLSCPTPKVPGAIAGTPG